MKALTDYTEFISENVVKFHNLISNYENNKDKFKDEMKIFISELCRRAGETIDIEIDNLQLDTTVALIMQTTKLWMMFCEKYRLQYPDDPSYFDDWVIMDAFTSVYKKGFESKNETTE